VDSKDLRQTPGPSLTADQRRVMAQWRAYLISGGPKPPTNSLARLQGDQVAERAPEPSFALAQQATRVLLAKRWALKQLHALGLLRKPARDARLAGNVPASRVVDHSRAP
jgi:hypothetical protein